MGAKTQILLVTALLLGQAQAAEIVAAREHPAFWLWSGVKASDELKNAQTVYLHQGSHHKIDATLADRRESCSRPAG